MLPLRDTIPSRTTPVVTIALIVLNALAFLIELGQGAGLGRFLAEYGLVPVRYHWVAEQHPLDLVGRFGPVFTSMFLHGGWLHFLGNMLFLWIFGDNVEDRLGRWTFVAFYAVCGLAAAMLQVHLLPRAGVPMIGASGAIAGVLGAYLVLFPRSRVLTAVPVFFFLHVIEVPAVLFLGVWFLLQFLSAGLEATRGAADAAGGVAWWAHVGGFAAGALLGPPLARLHARRKPKTYPTREIFHPW